MAFLTMIAPLVALTYPIDKINDGSAQAFNMWMKEYLFNLLIQPMHMILYFILISSSFQLASENFLYGIVAICFMVPAEKIVRKFFGFDKAQTPGLLAGAGGAALAMSGLRGLNKFARGGKGPGGADGGKDGKKDDKNPRFKQTNTFDELAEDGAGDTKEDKKPESESPQENIDNEDKEDKVLEQYNEQGYGQNDEGHYYNPLTDEYDADYDPHNDSSYSPKDSNQGTSSGENIDDENTASAETQSAGTQVKLSDKLETGDSEYTRKGEGNKVHKMTNKEKEKERRKVKRKAVTKVIGRKTWSGTKKLAKSTVRTGAKVAGATVLGMAGGIIGAATGDMKTVLSSATTGGAIGSAIGARVANDMEGIGGRVRSFKQEIANETNDDNERNEVARKQFMKNKEIRKIYEQELGIKGPDKRAKIDEAMEQALEYKKYGVNNDKIIAQAMKEEGLGLNATDRKRIMAAKIAEKVNGSQKTLEDQMKALKDRRNYSQAQIDRLRKAVANIDGNVT